jgi:hypothetical protein
VDSGLERIPGDTSEDQHHLINKGIAVVNRNQVSWYRWLQNPFDYPFFKKRGWGVVSGTAGRKEEQEEMKFVLRCHLLQPRWSSFIPFSAQVEYKCESFLEKNRDTVHDMLVEVMREGKVCGASGSECCSVHD